MKKRIWFFIFGIILLSSFTFAADCQPSYPPKTFKGNVYYNGSLLSGEYTLNAILQEEKVGQTQILNGVFENLQVSSCYGNVGEVSFFVYNESANEHYVIDSEWGGEPIIINLTLNELPPKENPCGNGLIDLGEECDLINLAGRTSCLEGYEGTISCSDSCEIDYSGCSLAPYCGDGIINNGETCSSCSQDVGECPVEESSSSSGSGGGSGGGSSGGSYTKKENVSTNETETNTEELSLTLGETNEENPEENEESKQGFFRTTGSAISDFSKTKTGKGVLVVIGIVLVIGVFMFFSTKKKNNIEKTFKK